MKSGYVYEFPNFSWAVVVLLAGGEFALVSIGEHVESGLSSACVVVEQNGKWRYTPEELEVRLRHCTRVTNKKVALVPLDEVSQTGFALGDSVRKKELREYRHRGTGNRPNLWKVTGVTKCGVTGQPLLRVRRLGNKNHEYFAPEFFEKLK